MLEAEKVKVVKIWKKSFNNGIIILENVRHCDENQGEILCVTCINQLNENKEFEVDLNLIKTQCPN